MTPQKSIAHSRITAKIGEGGMGEVWQAIDTKLQRNVAIKILPDALAHEVAHRQRSCRPDWSLPRHPPDRRLIIQGHFSVVWTKILLVASCYQVVSLVARVR